MQRRLDQHYANVLDYRDSIGYPSNLDLDHLKPMQRFLLTPFNNVGGLKGRGRRHSPLHTIAFEQELIHTIAALYGISDAADCHGFVTSGGTEANLQGLWQARETYPEATLYSSASSHYSIAKCARLLRIKHHILPVDDAGELDYRQLATALQQQAGQTAIVSLNIGSTMQGAIDRLDRVKEILQQQQMTGFHIHCDAALFGMMLPFIADAPCPSFRNGMHSLAISGHKFIGCPYPSGIVLTQTPQAGAYVDYIQSADTTVSGSRNGHAPLLLWYGLMTRGLAGLEAEVKTCISNAAYLSEQMTLIGYANQRGTHSNIVWFRTPDPAIVAKWDLAVAGNIAHVVVMQHVTRHRLDRFLADLTRT